MATVHRFHRCEHSPSRLVDDSDEHVSPDFPLVSEGNVGQRTFLWQRGGVLWFRDRISGRLPLRDSLCVSQRCFRFALDSLHSIVVNELKGTILYRPPDRKITDDFPNPEH